MQCRACMQIKCIMIDMNVVCKDDGKSLFDYFNDCTQLQASPSDNFPKTLCKICAQNLQIAYNFRTCSLQSQEQLKKLLSLPYMESESMVITTKECYTIKAMEATTDDPLEMEFKTAVKALTKPEFEVPGNDFGKENSSKWKIEQLRKLEVVIKTEEENEQDELLCEMSNDQSQAIELQEIEKEEFNYNFAHGSGGDLKEKTLGSTIPEGPRFISGQGLTLQQPGCFPKGMTQEPEEKECGFVVGSYKSRSEPKTLLRYITVMGPESQKEYFFGSAKNESQTTDQQSDEIGTEDFLAGYALKGIQESKSKGNKVMRVDVKQSTAQKNLSKIQNTKGDQDQAGSHKADANEKSKTSTTKQKKKHLCSFCPRELCSKLSLEAHERKHLNIKPDLIQCPNCPKKFTANYINKHIKTVHIGERKFICDICGDTYKSHPQLSRHKLLHSKERRLACAVCDKRFTEKSHIKVHMRIHTGELPFACHLCDRRFRIRVHLTYHLQLHNNIKQKCEECGKEFKHAKSLRDHSFVHSGVMPYNCSICGYGSPKRENFTKHMLRKHKTSLTADELFAMFKANTGRSPHVKPAEELETMKKA